MRRVLRLLGTIVTVLGVLTFVWAMVVWQWQDPFTALYTTWKQHQLAQQYEKRVATFVPPKPVHHGISLAAERKSIAADAARYRATTHEGQAIGRIRVPRMGINMVLVDGTSEGSLMKGPGRDLQTYMPGQNRLVYIAGHRTTYLAPFSHIDSMRPGDSVTIEVPYATFLYRVTGYRIVPATDLSVLKSPNHELLALQACHPRFFATHRYIVYAKLARVLPRGGTPYDLSAAPAATQPIRR
ncbi:MAG TPA: class E sortase [Gaiellaceae bacterium]|nr:class E sortase [Gaiellaceae bacterium]